jgi:RNA polymerase sigma-70 factor (ECF subfamily)
MDDFASLVARGRKGDADAWNALFELFHPIVFRYLIGHTRDSAVAEDLSQEVFVAAVRGIRKLRHDSRPGVEGWFIRIARNKLSDWHRSRKDEPWYVVDASGDPADVAVARVASEELRRAMDKLTMEQQDILVQRFILDRSLEQVAASTDRSVGAVKAMQHRALASLERVLEEEGYDDHG